MEKLSELDKGQIAYRDSDGHLMILPVDNENVRSAFITRLMNEYFDDRNLNQLLEDFKQAGKDVVEDNTKKIEQVKEDTY